MDDTAMYLAKGHISRNATLHSHVTRFQSVCVRSVLEAFEWRSGLRHCNSMLEVSLQTLVRSRVVSQKAVIGSPKGRRTIGSASSGLREGLAGIGHHCKIIICS